jgi:hypothetical protein
MVNHFTHEGERRDSNRIPLPASTGAVCQLLHVLTITSMTEEQYHCYCTRQDTILCFLYALF